ncbi:MAG: hypothetical protein K6E98_00775 [Lachnospiraceae bacterium]|nr:hypothetical protein [Lachnospiraceae bacterium]
MSTKSLLHQAKLKEWASRFIDQKASGLSVAEWCKQNNLSQHKFFYWKRLLKEEAIEQTLPDIVPLAMPSVTADVSQTQVTSQVPTLARETRASCTTFASNSCARLFINGVCIEIESSAPESFITNLIRAVRHA